MTSLACGPTRQLLKWTPDWLIEIRGYVCWHCSRSSSSAIYVNRLKDVWSVNSIEFKWVETIFSFVDIISRVPSQKSISSLLQRKWFSLSVLIFHWILDCEYIIHIFTQSDLFIYAFICVYMCVYVDTYIRLYIINTAFFIYRSFHQFGVYLI